MTTSVSRAMWLVLLAVPLLLVGGPRVWPADAERPAPAAQERPPTAPIISPGRLVVDWIEPPDEQSTSDLEVAAALKRPSPSEQTVLPELTARTVGGFTACFDDDVPASVRSVVERSLAIWDDALLLDGPSIEIDVYWTSFPAAASLAASGPSRFVQDSVLPRPEARYPAGLANQLTGIDYSPRQQCDRSADGEAVLYLNSTAGGDGSVWHLTTNPPAADKIDLESVVTHELAHSLGFLSSASIDGDGIQRWPFDFGAPYLYDTFFRRCPAVDDCTQSTISAVEVSSQASLTGDDLWFGVPNVAPLQLYAPETWANGSSLSHLDEDRYTQSGAFSLMSPFMDRGEEHNGLDNATLAMVQTLGWPLADLAATPTDIEATAGDALVRLGFSVADLSASPPPVDFEVTLWRDGVVEQTVTVPGSPVVLSGLVNGQIYQFSIQSRTAAGLSPRSELSQKVRPLELPPFATAESFVAQSFQQLLGRPPTITEQTTWAGRTRASEGNLTSVLNQLAEEPGVLQQRQIVRLYLGFFNRQPDAGGLDYWIGQLRDGQTLERIALQFARASEFEQGTAVSDRAFVTATYRRVLARDPDQGGLDYWVEQLQDGLDRGRLLLLFSESSEHLETAGPNSEIIVLTRALLGRQPTGAELNEWLDVVDRLGRLPYLDHVVASEEYTDRVAP